MLMKYGFCNSYSMISPLSVVLGQTQLTCLLRSPEFKLEAVVVIQLQRISGMHNWTFCLTNIYFIQVTDPSKEYPSKKSTHNHVHLLHPSPWMLTCPPIPSSWKRFNLKVDPQMCETYLHSLAYLHFLYYLHYLHHFYFIFICITWITCITCIECTIRITCIVLGRDGRDGREKPDSHFSRPVFAILAMFISFYRKVIVITGR